jgi:hypothetical protein
MDLRPCLSKTKFRQSSAAVLQLWRLSRTQREGEVMVTGDCVIVPNGALVTHLAKPYERQWEQQYPEQGPNQVPSRNYTARTKGVWQFDSALLYVFVTWRSAQGSGYNLCNKYLPTGECQKRRWIERAAHNHCICSGHRMRGRWHLLCWVP